MSYLCECLLFLVLGLSQGKATPAPSRVPADYAARRAKALELYKAQKHMEALPLLEVLHAEKPDDVPVLEALAFDVMSHAATLDDAEARKKERVRGRQLAEQAKALGDNSNLLQFLLDADPDGNEKGFSSRAEVDAAMKQGAAAYAKSDFDAALAAHTRALELDPKQYFAALFIGDVHFVHHEYDLAGTFFRRAIEIDPNIETAYRYWVDSLAAQDKSDEAKEKFIGAIVADPYNRHSWIGLSQWAPKHRLTLAHPSIQMRGSVEDKGKDEKGQTQTNCNEPL